MPVIVVNWVMWWISVSYTHLDVYKRQDAKICKVDVDDQPELARQFRVMSIPTLMVFKDGQAVKREVGAKSKAELLDMLNV